LETDVLIVGAGPFGLALAALASERNIQYAIVGRPMEFWRRNMPEGMYLRSACDWHLDPLNVHTIERFVELQKKTAKEVEPLALDFYLSYVDWFQTQKHIEPIPIYIERLDHFDNHFVATTANDVVINAERVVLAPGFKHFPNIPNELKQRIGSCIFRHTCEFVDFNNAAGKRYLIVGGRQSAFEWAALLIEKGAAAVHLSHRHDSPKFEVAEWAWVTELVDHLAQDPNWFRRLSDEEKDSISLRLWSEGRLKIEPWLKPRLEDARVKLWPQTEVTNTAKVDGACKVSLTNGEVIEVDEIILATGYKVDIASLPYLASGNIMPGLETRNGFPVLDDHFETSIPGLFITSMPAVQDFGPYFGFTISVRTSALLICDRLLGKA
jgi:cation diffusion facilitator CzcD-associated flavoprotein CzcO